GLGGDANTIWHCDNDSGLIYELLTTDFSVDRSALCPAPWPYGIGGDADTIWHCDVNSDIIYELFTTDFSVDRFADSPSTIPYGVGGDADTIWHCDDASNLIYELDADGVAAGLENKSAGIAAKMMAAGVL
ncbi:unnamed protein product, partial [marine sediment metagenome]